MHDMYIAYSWMAVSAAAFSMYWLHLHYTKRFGMGKDTKRIEQLERLVEDLENQVQELSAISHDRIEQLHERVDFAERILLERPAPLEEPAEPTPV